MSRPVLSEMIICGNKRLDLSIKIYKNVFVHSKGSTENQNYM